MITIRPGNAQHIGVRKDQQDAFGFTDLEDKPFLKHGGSLAVVADGMGGLNFGDLASRLAVHVFLREYMKKNMEETPKDALLRSLLAANRAVYEMACEKNIENEIGTTLVAAVINYNWLYWISVGDSRLYLFRNGQMTLLTRDHYYGKVLSRKVRKGLITREEAEAHPDRLTLSSYLGLENIPEIDNNLRPFPLEPGDRLILCSDGLYGSLTEAEMATPLSLNSPQKCAEELVKLAIAKKILHQDNATVAILSLEEEETSNSIKAGSRNVRRQYLLFLSIFIFLIICIGGFYGVSQLKMQAPHAVISPNDKKKKPLKESTSSADKESPHPASEVQVNKINPDSLGAKQPSEPEEAKPKTLKEHPTTKPSSDDTISLNENVPPVDEKSSHPASEVQVDPKRPDSLSTKQTSEPEDMKPKALDKHPITPLPLSTASSVINNKSTSTVDAPIKVEEKKEMDINVDEPGKTKNN